MRTTRKSILIMLLCISICMNFSTISVAENGYAKSDTFSYRNSWICCAQLQAKHGIKIWSKPGTNETYSDSEVVYITRFDNYPLEAVRIIENSASKPGHYWYEVKVILFYEDEQEEYGTKMIKGYVWYKDVSEKTMSWYALSYDCSKPSYLESGESFQIDGRVEAADGAIISSLQGFIYAGQTTSGDPEQQSDIVYPNNNQYYLSGIDSSLHFDWIMQTGYHTYAVKVSLSSFHIQDDTVVNISKSNIEVSQLTTTYYVGSTTPTTPVMTTGAGRTISDGDYLIAYAANPSWYMCTNGTSIPAADGTNVIFCGPLESSPNPSDFWTVTYIDDGGFYSIKQKGTNMSLDVNGASTSNGANIQVYTSNNTSAQTWSIGQNTNGSYRIQAKCSGLCLDLTDGSMWGGNNIQQWTSNDSSAQEWTFIPYQSFSAAQNKITFHAQGGTLGEAIASRSIDGVNTGRLGGQLIVYQSPLQYSDCNIYGHEIAVDSTGTVVGIREYGNENQLLIPNGGFVLSGQYSWPTDENDGYHFTVNATLGQYAGVNFDTNQAYLFDSYSDYLANFKYVKTNEQYGDLPEPVRQNWRFEGWYTAAEGGTRILSTSLYSTSELYAHWTSNIHTVTYNANGGANEPTAQTKTFGTVLQLSATIPTRSGWYFLGWAESATATAAAYLPGSSFTKDASTTLYAVWAQPDFVLPSALITVGEEAFANCAFRFARLSQNTTKIQPYAFSNCANLKIIYIPSATVTIDKDAFSGVTGLTILGKTGSYAQTYAQQKGFTFVPVA